jgi:hypothetical protein
MSTPAGDIAAEVKTLLDVLLVDGGLCAAGYGYRTAKIFDMQLGSPSYSLSYQGHFERLDDQGDDYFYTLNVAARYGNYTEEAVADRTLMEIEHTVKSAFHRLGDYGTRYAAGEPLWLAVTFHRQSQLLPSPVEAKGWRVMSMFMRFTR